MKQGSIKVYVIDAYKLEKSLGLLLSDFISSPAKSPDQRIVSKPFDKPHRPQLPAVKAFRW